jgi:hypothetical protein
VVLHIKMYIKCGQAVQGQAFAAELGVEKSNKVVSGLWTPVATDVTLRRWLPKT